MCSLPPAALPLYICRRAALRLVSVSTALFLVFGLVSAQYPDPPRTWGTPGQIVAEVPQQVPTYDYSHCPGFDATVAPTKGPWDSETKLAFNCWGEGANNKVCFCFLSPNTAWLGSWSAVSRDGVAWGPVEVTPYFTFYRKVQGPPVLDITARCGDVWSGVGCTVNATALCSRRGFTRSGAGGRAYTCR